MADTLPPSKPALGRAEASQQQRGRAAEAAGAKSITKKANMSVAAKHRSVAEDRAAAKAAEESAAVAATKARVKNTYALLRKGMAALCTLQAAMLNATSQRPHE